MEQMPSSTTPTPVWQNPRFLTAGGLAVLFFLFAVQNARSVEVSFLFWDFRLRLIILMLLCAAAGAGVWELIRYLRRRRDEA